MAHRRVTQLWDDLSDFLEMVIRILCLWDAYRFLLATALFGLLVPVHLVGQLIARVRALRSKRSAIKPNNCHYWMGGAIWIAILCRRPCHRLLNRPLGSQRRRRAQYRLRGCPDLAGRVSLPAVTDGICVVVGEPRRGHRGASAVSPARHALDRAQPPLPPFYAI